MERGEAVAQSPMLGADLDKVGSISKAATKAANQLCASPDGLTPLHSPDPCFSALLSPAAWVSTSAKGCMEP